MILHCVVHKIIVCSTSSSLDACFGDNMIVFVIEYKFQLPYSHKTMNGVVIHGTISERDELIPIKEVVFIFFRSIIVQNLTRQNNIYCIASSCLFIFIYF